MHGCACCNATTPQISRNDLAAYQASRFHALHFIIPGLVLFWFPAGEWKSRLVVWGRERRSRGNSHPEKTTSPVAIDLRFERDACFHGRKPGVLRSREQAWKFSRCGEIGWVVFLSVFSYVKNQSRPTKNSSLWEISGILPKHWTCVSGTCVYIKDTCRWRSSWLPMYKRDRRDSSYAIRYFFVVRRI